MSLIGFFININVKLIVMSDKFCLSPWRSSCYGDDHFQVNVKPFCENKSNIATYQTDQTDTLQEIGPQKADWAQFKEQIRPSHRSADITPSKKQQLRLNVITNNSNNLKIGPKKNKQAELIKDSHQLLINRLIRLKQEGKLHLKESIGQRILRF